LKRKRNESSYVDLIDEDQDDDEQSSSSNSSGSDDVEEPTDLRPFPRQAIVNNRKEKVISHTVKIDELFNKSKRPSRYTSMKINTIRDDDHVREEMLRSVNQKWSES